MVVAPFYTIAVLVACLASNQSLIGMMWIVIIPAAYIVFSAVVGITVNLALPLMEWDNEMRVVKQGASTIVSMLVGVTSVAIPGLALFLLKGISTNIIMMSTLVGLVIITVFLYILNSKKDLRGIR